MSPYIHLDAEAELLSAMLTAFHAHGWDLGIKVADHRGTDLLKWSVRYTTPSGTVAALLLSLFKED